LAAIVESSADAIIGNTLDGVITSWNAGAEHMFGYSHDEIVGRNVSLLMPPDRADELRAILERVQHGGRVEQLETRRRCKDGRILDVSISVSPVRDARGAVVGASTVSRDFTERNRAQITRRALEDRLHQSERLESLGQLAGGIAHDFNNLLGVIMNYAAFVAEETAAQPAVRADVEQIQTAAEQAARLTKQLLIFARHDTVTLGPLDLNAIVADVRNLLSLSIGEPIALKIDGAANLPAIRADRGQVEQVLLNLAVNARDAMPQGGTLTIETSPAELEEGSLHLHPAVTPGHYVELALSDTGTGMSADVVDHIFEPFFTTKPKGQGTGLGLATVYGIVAEAGGTISVHSQEGVGTTFRLLFPISDRPAPAPAPSNRSETDSQGQGETILVVDDEPAVLQFTSRILRQNGYATLEAATFEEALSLAAAHDFQLLLTDSVMPHMSGSVLAERIDGLRPLRAVLYMSGYSDGVSSPQRLADQGVALLQKPFNRKTLLDRVHVELTKPPLATT
jgi:PAS domain S-box-containing protein